MECTCVLIESIVEGEHLHLSWLAESEFIMCWRRTSKVCNYGNEDCWSTESAAHSILLRHQLSMLEN